MEREKEQMLREKEELMLRLQDYEEKTKKAEKGGSALSSGRRRSVEGQTDGQTHTQPGRKSKNVHLSVTHHPKQRLVEREDSTGYVDYEIVLYFINTCASSVLNASHSLSF